MSRCKRLSHATAGSGRMSSRRHVVGKCRIAPNGCIPFFVQTGSGASTTQFRYCIVCRNSVARRRTAVGNFGR